MSPGQSGDWKTVKTHDISKFIKKGDNLIAAEVSNGGGAAGLILRAEIDSKDGKSINIFSDSSWLCAKQNQAKWETNAFQDQNWTTAKTEGDVSALPWTTHNFLFEPLLADEEKSIWINHKENRDKKVRIDIAKLNKEKAPQVSVSYENGRAFIDVNGKKIAPFAYISHRLIFQEFWERQIDNFAKAGTPVLIINLPPFTKLKKGDNSDLNEKLDEEIRRHLVLNPDAYIIPAFTLNPPQWWLEENPEEWVGYASGPVDTKNINGNRGRACLASMASVKWREYCKSNMSEMIRFINKQPWSKRVIGYRFCYGINGEFHYSGMRIDMPDTGLAMTSHFREWLKNKYTNTKALQAAWNDNKVDFNTVKAPNVEERKNCEHLLLRSPATEAKVLDFYQCMQDTLADTVIEFAAHIKKETNNRLLVGLYYGYFFGMPYPPEGFHLEIQKLLASPSIDFLSAPYIYDRRARDVGGNGLSRSLPDLFRIYKKLHILEDDTFTHLTEYNPDHSWLKTEEESVAVMKRQLCGAICNGYGIQYVEFPEKSKLGWFESPVIMNTIKEGIELYKNAPATSERSGSQICVVISPESIMYLASTAQPATTSYNLISGTVYELAKTGAPFDVITPEEIRNKSLPDYRLYIFLNCFYLTEKQKKDIAETVKRNGKTAIWLYAAGSVTDKGVSDKSIAELTGISVKRVDQKTAQVLQLIPDAHKMTKDLNKNELEFPIETREIKIEKEGPFFYVADEKSVILGVHKESGKPAMAVRKFDNWTSIYCAVPFMSQTILNKCLEEAGVHRYLKSGDAVYAHPPYLMVHTKTGGKQTVFLPETAKLVKTMFSDKTVGKNIKQFDYEFPANSTTLFLIE